MSRRLGTLALVVTLAACSQGTTAPSASAPATPSTTVSDTVSDTVSTTTTSTSTSTTTSTPPSTTSTVPSVVLPDGVAADGSCPASPRAAVLDRDHQRAWLCTDGMPVRVFPVTTARSQPEPGEYAVLEKSMQATSTFTGGFTRMTHFVVFARGENTGARVGFHSVPTHPDGRFVQPLESVGDEARWGESSGCIRAVPDDAVAVWDWLEVGDAVRVIS